MFQLVYISTAREPISQTMLDSILEASRRNNTANDITGLLVAGGRRFLQALEGPEQPVLDAFARIKADPRHHAFVLLTGRSAEKRTFGDWAMAFEHGEDAEEASLYATVDALTESFDDKSLRAQFLGFAELHGTPA